MTSSLHSTSAKLTKRGPAGADIISAGRANDEVQRKEREEREEFYE